MKVLLTIPSPTPSWRQALPLQMVIQMDILYTDIRTLLNKSETMLYILYDVSRFCHTSDFSFSLLSPQGSGVIKAGFAGDQIPKYCFPN